MNKPQIEPQRFEFLLYINNHIICQRFFDVKGYNENVRESFEIKSMITDLVGMNEDFQPNKNAVGVMGIIPTFLKVKSLENLWEYYSPYKTQNEKDDNFQFEVRVDGEVIASSIFDGNKFPPRVRYSVNIKELIPEIISTIRYYLSKKDGQLTQYGPIKLNRHNIFELAQ